MLRRRLMPLLFSALLVLVGLLGFPLSSPAEEAAHGGGDPSATSHGEAEAGHGAAEAGHGAMTSEMVSEKLMEVGIHAFNFALLLGILGYFLKRPLGDFLANRRKAIEGELEESSRIRAEAEARYQEYDRRLKGFDAEVSGLVERVRQECQVEQDQAVKAARKLGEAVLNTTRKALDEEMRRARVELRREAIDLAVKLAESVLAGQVSGEDQKRLAEAYLSQVGSSSRREVADR